MLDGIVIIIILLFGAIGHSRGIVKTVATLINSLIALVLAFLAYPVVNGILKLTPLYAYINKGIIAKVSETNFGAGIQTQGEVILNSINWLPDFMKEQIVKNNNIEVYKLLNVSNITEYVSASLTNIVIGILAVFITWVIIKILLAIFVTSLDKIAKALPVISSLNKMGGFVIGAAKGLLCIWILCLMMPMFINNPSFESFYIMLQESYFAKFLYENNMILYAFNAICNK